MSCAASHSEVTSHVLTKLINTGLHMNRYTLSSSASEEVNLRASQKAWEAIIYNSCQILQLGAA